MLLGTIAPLQSRLAIKLTNGTASDQAVSSFSGVNVLPTCIQRWAGPWVALLVPVELPIYDRSHDNAFQVSSHVLISSLSLYSHLDGNMFTIPGRTLTIPFSFGSIAATGPLSLHSRSGVTNYV